MGFFDSIGDIIGTIGDVIGFGSDIAQIATPIIGAVSAGQQAFGDRDPTPAEIQAGKAIEQAIGMAPEATAQTRRISQIGDILLGGESDPKFRQMVGEDESRLRADYISSIDDMILQSNRNRMRSGNPAFINPERQDEMRAGALMQAFENARQTSRGNVRALLNASANVNNMSLSGLTNIMGSLTGAGSAASGMVPTQVADQQNQMAAQGQFFKDLPSAIGQVGGSINQLLSGFAPSSFAASLYKSATSLVVMLLSSSPRSCNS